MKPRLFGRRWFAWRLPRRNRRGCLVGAQSCCALESLEGAARLRPYDTILGPPSNSPRNIRRVGDNAPCLYRIVPAVVVRSARRRGTLQPVVDGYRQSAARRELDMNLSVARRIQLAQLAE